MWDGGPMSRPGCVGWKRVRAALQNPMWRAQDPRPLCAWPGVTGACGAGSGEGLVGSTPTCPSSAGVFAKRLLGRAWSLMSGRHWSGC